MLQLNNNIDWDFFHVKSNQFLSISSVYVSGSQQGAPAEFQYVQ